MIDACCARLSARHTTVPPPMATDGSRVRERCELCRLSGPSEALPSMLRVDRAARSFHGQHDAEHSKR